MPRVSILIPVYNSEKTVLRAIDSALSQTITDVEVIVIDDGSKDNTASLVLDRQSQDARLRFHQRAINGGPSAARNSGLRLASGDWIALLDADDMIAPQRLERLLARAEEDDVLVADNLELYDLHADKVVKLGIDPAVIAPELHLDCGAFILRCRTNQPNAVDFGLLKPLMRNSHLRKHGISYKENVRHGEDFCFYVDVLLAGGKLLVIPEAYYRYTERTGSISRKESGVSATRVSYDSIESFTRELAANPKYSVVKRELNLRADAMRRLRKVISFRQHSRLAKLALLPAMIVDNDMREHLSSRIRAKAGRMWPGRSSSPLS